MQKPRLVLVHGSLSSAHQWVDYPGLLPGIDVVCIDLPGHGTRIGEEFTMGAAIETVANAAVGHGPVFLAGHSLGAYMATAYAAGAPQDIAGLMLLGATGNPASRLAGLYRGYSWLVRRTDHKRLARVRDAVARRLGLPDDQIPDPSTYEVLPAAWQAIFDSTPLEQIRRVPAPIAFINGQFDQMRAGARQFRRAVPDARYHLIPRASHLAPLTHAPQVAACMRQFMDESLGRD